MKTFLRKTLSLLLCILIVLAGAGSAFADSSSLSTAGGTGTENDPYLISTAAQLQSLASAVNSGNSFSGAFFRLANDIALNDISDVESCNENSQKTQWTPIGSGIGIGFAGIFDGNSHSIRGLFISSDESFKGLFGYVDGGTIKNVTVEASFISGLNYVGSIAGCVACGTISDCVSNAVVKGSEAVGGIVGDVEIIEDEKTVTISDCTNNGAISGSYSVGGIVGMAVSFASQVSVEFNGLKNNGSVDGYESVGGIIGGNATGTVHACVNSGAVNGTNYIGGIAGYNGDTLRNSANSGNVNGSGNYTGGIVGWNAGTASNCINSGSVDGGRFGVTGGIAGHNGSGSSDGLITDSVNSGTVKGNTDVGAIVGEAEDGNSEISNCYYLEGSAVDGNGTVQNGVGGSTQGDVTGELTALSEEEMKNEASFEGLNFDETWTFDPETGLPVIKETIESQELVPSGISVKTMPSKTSYTVGDFLDTTGLVITESYTNGTSADFTSDFTCNPETLSTAGTQTITVTLHGITTTFNVTVSNIVYQAVFKADGNIVDTIDYTVETASITPPEVPEKTGYTGVWESYTLAVGGITVNAVYSLATYTVTFIANGETVDTVEYTLETESITAPEVPSVPNGFNGRWSEYDISECRDIVVHAIYQPPMVMTAAAVSMSNGSEHHLLLSANYEITSKYFVVSDSRVVDIDENGKITALSEGECEILVVATGLDEFGNPVVAKSTVIVSVVESNQPKNLKEGIQNAFYGFFKNILPAIIDNVKRIFMFISFLTENT